MKVPNGKYLVWVSAGYYPYPKLYIDLNINGDLLYEGELDWKRFYSKRWFYRFFDSTYSEKPRSLWENYVSKISPAWVREITVTHGYFYVKGENSYLGALVLVPVDKKKDFDRMVEQIRLERARYFYNDLFLLRAENEPFVMTDAEMVLFAPPATSIMPWSGISEKATCEVMLQGIPGERLAFHVAIRPFGEELGVTTVLSAVLMRNRPQQTASA